MSKAIDCFAPLTHDEALQLKSDGYVAVCRYLCAKNHPVWGKGVTTSEAKDISDAGLYIISNYEANPISADYFNFQRGIFDGLEAVDEAVWLGQPKGTAIYFSVDFDAQDSDMEAIRQYLQGVKRSLAGYKLGVYGSYRVMSNVAADFYWQTAAWSNGQHSPRACLYQDEFAQKVHNMSVDEDAVLKPVGWWHLPASHNPHEAKAV